MQCNPTRSKLKSRNDERKLRHMVKGGGCQQDAKIIHRFWQAGPLSIKDFFPQTNTPNIMVRPTFVIQLASIFSLGFVSANLLPKLLFFFANIQMFRSDPRSESLKLGLSLLS
jgi:hypothetical protein